MFSSPGSNREIEPKIEFHLCGMSLHDTPVSQKTTHVSLSTGWFAYSSSATWYWGIQ